MPWSRRAPSWRRGWRRTPSCSVTRRASSGGFVHARPPPRLRPAPRPGTTPTATSRSSMAQPPTDLREQSARSAATAPPGTEPGGAVDSSGRMNLDWSEEQVALRETVARFAESLNDDSFIDRERASAFSRERWRRCAEFGIQGLPIPREFGGMEQDHMTTILAMEELGHGCRDQGL